MPSSIHAYRVFFASPGGLLDERKAFRDAVEACNHVEAIPRGVLFIPVGWEDTLAGVGRPQGLINQDLRGCDFFVLVLWDRWGTPPGDAEGRFTSGTEEEMALARELLRDRRAPMRQIAAFFKGVDPRKLSDPGPQLARVLEFRGRLDEERELLYHTFDSPDRFAAVLRRHLSAWLLAHENGFAPAADLPPEPSPVPDAAIREAEAPGGGAELEEAWRLADGGRRTEAETMFSRAVVRADDPRAFLAFGRFLHRDGRLGQATVMFERARELALDSGDGAYAATAIRWLGRVFLTRGDLPRAEEHFRAALEIHEAIGCAREAAADQNSLGHVLKTRGDLAGAEEMYRKALEINVVSGRPEGAAASYGNLGRVLDTRGDLAGAEAMHRKALEIDEKLGRLEGLADQYGNLGLVLHKRGDLAGAEAMHRKALEIEEKLGRLEGMASAYGNLALVLQARGDLGGAEEMHRRSLAIDEKLGRLEGIAITSWNLGEIARRRGHREGAGVLYERALALFEQVGIPDRANVVRSRLESLG
jgi:tetratricopeptide (TPR) repeat protein